MPAHNFVHLHVHSEYSLLDAMCTIAKITDTVKKLKMPAVALTDHGNLFGAIEFYSTARKKGIKPIIGFEAYVAPNKRTDRNAKGIGEASFHFTLLARNEKGYKNLMKLSTIAYREGFYYRPRIDKECLAQNSEGLIGLSGCLSSEFSQQILQDRIALAEKTAQTYRDILGKENFFLEVQDNGMAEQKKVVSAAVEIGKKLGIPLVATNDIHYISREDAREHDVLLCIATNKLVTDTQRKRMSTNEFYLRTPEEMAAIFKDIPEAISNTLEIAERCSLELDLETKRLPKFIPPEGKTNHQYLKELVEASFRHKYLSPSEDVMKRLNFELKTIADMGFSSYFLIVWDFVRFAKTNGIPVGPGRGSAAGCLVSYCLGITDLDPLKYDLLFERFLNPGRKEMPDIDIDFCKIGREKVMDYVRCNYGKDNVCQVGTFGKMKARLVIRDVGRVLGIPLNEVDKIAKKIPPDPGTLLKTALESDSELKEMYKTNRKSKDLFDIAMKLEGLPRHPTTHAAGVVIADKSLIEYTPIYVNDGEESTQYTSESMQSLGLLKMDFLGLQTLTVIDHALKLIKTVRGLDIKPEDIPLDDKKTYEMLGRGETSGVFQMESSGYRDLCQKIKPTKFEDIIALQALYRPGVLQAGLLDTFIRRKQGQEEISFIHPSLEPILKETYGVIIYQEQVMKISSVLGNFAPSEADSLRKAMGKKKPELLESYREQFITNAFKENHIKKETAGEIFSLMEYFGGYGFNKSHSAAYAILSVRTAYLKANYPVEYMCVLLSIEMGDTEKIADYIDECGRIGIEILPPDINKSNADFMIDSGKIRFGLEAIKGAGSKAIESIVSTRGRIGAFKTIYQFCEEVDSRAVDRRVMEGMIKCGAFDSLGAKRAQLAAVLDSVVASAQKVHQAKKLGQGFLFGSGGAVSDSTMYPELPAIEEWPEEVLLSFEKEVIGFFITGHPLAKYENTIRTFSTTSTTKLSGLKDGEDVVLGGVVSQLLERTIKSGPKVGQKMGKIKFKDLDGTCQAIAFPSELVTYADYLMGDRVVFISGKVDFRSEEPTVKISEVIPVDQAVERLAGNVVITLKSGGITDMLLKGIKDILFAHPGSCPVFVQMISPSDAKTFIKMGNDFFVTPAEEFINEMEALVGRGNVKLIRKNYVHQNSNRR